MIMNYLRQHAPIRSFILYASMLCFGLTGLYAQNNNPTIAVCNGQQYICASSQNVTLCVNILVNPGYPYAGIISEFEIDWGDGTPNTTVPGGLNPPSQTHVYDVGNFFGSCTYEKEYIIKLLTKHSNPAIEPANSAFFLKIRNPPKPDFNINPNPVCTDKPVTLSTIPCPSQGINYQFWNLGGGITGTGSSITHTFTTPGTQTVQHCVGNVCDTVCVSKSLSVIDAAVANLVADSGVVAGSANPYKVCLDGGFATVRLNAGASLNVTSAYMWTITPGSGWQWVLPPGSPGGSIARVRFSAPGIYTVTVKVNNACGEHDSESITIEVVQAPLLTLNPFPDTCVAVNYTPLPQITNATYKINNVAQATFPVSLPLSPNPYIVEATLLNECGNQVLRDTFRVQAPQDITIVSPANMTVCAGSAAIPLQTSLPGAWSGGAGLISVLNGDTLFNPTVAGVYQLVVSRGGGVCRRADTVTVTVQEAYPLNLNQPAPACITANYTPSPFDPNATYTVNGAPQSSFPLPLDAAGSPYTIVATANNTCGDVDKSVVLEVIEPVDVAISAPGDTVICSGTDPLPLLASDTIGVWSGAGIISTPQGYFFDPVTPGDYQLVFARGFDLCRRADTLHIRVEPGDGVQAGPDLYVCNTQSVLNLVASPSGGTFSGTALSGTSIDVAQLQLNTPYTYIYMVANLPPACNTDEMLVTVAAPPDAGFALSQDTSCVGKVVTVIPAATGAVNFSVNWGDGGTGSGLSHTYTQAGTYGVTLTATTQNPLTNAVLCTATSTQSIHIIEPIDADSIGFLASPDTGCAPLTVTFDNISKAENARYRWDFGNDITYEGAEPGSVVFEQGTEDTLYVVRLSVSNGCDSLVFTDTIRVFPRPKANFGITYLQPCSGGLLEASVLSTGNPQNNTFYTSTGLQQAASLTQSSFFQFFTGLQTDTVGIWLVTSNSCGVDTAYRQVVVNPTDVVSVIGLPDTTGICAGAAVTVINYSTPGAPVQWSVSNGNTFLGDTVQVVFSDPGDYFLTLYAYGCGFDSMVIPLTAHPLPTLAVQHEQFACPGDSVLFSLGTGAPDVLLFFGDGDSSNLKSVGHTYGQPGVYALMATAVSDRGCATDWSGTLEVLTPPEALIQADDSICAGAPARFFSAGQTPNTTCTWNFGDGNVADSCATTHIYQNEGLFTATLTVISGEGCRSVATAPVYVRNRPEAAFEADIIEPCSPAIVAFVSTAQGASGLDWSLGDGNVSVNAAFQHTYGSGGLFKVTLIATNEGICSDTFSKNINLFQTPEIDLDLDEKCTVAEGTDLRIITPPSNLVTVSSAGYNRTGDLHLALPEGTYQVRITSPEGCKHDTSIYILTPNELLLAVEEDSFFVCLGDSIFPNAKVNQTGVAFTWSPAVYLDDPTIANPAAQPWRPIIYTVTGVNQKGCAKSDTVRVEVCIDRDSGLFIPNAFTPNGDGVNDLFYMRNSNLAVLQYDEFLVFDKYDEKVFDLHDLPEGDKATPENPFFSWDGNFRGEKAEMGSYRYVIVIRYVDTQVRTFTGTLQLIR